MHKFMIDPQSIGIFPLTKHYGDDRSLRYSLVAGFRRKNYSKRRCKWPRDRRARPTPIISKVLGRLCSRLGPLGSLNRQYPGHAYVPSTDDRLLVSARISSRGRYLQRWHGWCRVEWRLLRARMRDMRRRRLRQQGRTWS